MLNHCEKHGSLEVSEEINIILNYFNKFSINVHK